MLSLAKLAGPMLENQHQFLYKEEYFRRIFVSRLSQSSAKHFTSQCREFIKTKNVIHIYLPSE